MRIIGLTGGIGSGKSTVAGKFQALGAGIVDTDVIAHQISGQGQPGAQAVARVFGTEFLDPQGTIDRGKLRELVFSNPAAKLKLDAALHPLIQQEALAQLQALPPDIPYALLVVPLLFETNAYADTIHRSLVIDCSEATQIERVKQRSGLDERTIRQIMAAQLARTERLARADDIISNEGSASQLMDNVKKLHEIYAQAYDL